MNSSESRRPQPFPDLIESPGSETNPKHYIPGFVWTKFFILMLGLALVAYGSSELWSPLSLLLTGTRATGEATRVIKTKEGLPDQVFLDDVHLLPAEEQRDRSYIFWNEFHFTSADGVSHQTRLRIGSQLKPLFSLLDTDGLPTTVTVCYDPSRPDNLCVPSVMSNWFAPGLVTFMGIVCALVGLALLYWARRPVDLA